LLPSKSDQNVIEAINAEIEFASKSLIELRPSSEFNYSSGKSRLINVKLDVPDLELYLNSLMPLDSNHQSVGAAGCIITYLSRSNSNYKIDLIKHFSLRDFMHLSV
jgi:hypothetical protein